MAGSSSKQLQSAFVAESTPGTTPATPGFTTTDTPVLLTATPSISESKTQHAGGARSGQSVQGLEVSGSIAGPMIYGNYDDLIASLLQGSWSSDVLKDGKATAAFTFENLIPAGAGGTDTMLRYRGVEATGGTITVESEGDVALSLDLMGMGADDATTTAITGATYTDPTNVTPLTASLDVGTIAFDGYTLDCFSQVEVSFAYEERNRQPKLGSYDLCGLTRGALVPTITARMYLEANFADIVNDARANHTAFSVTIPIGSVSGSKYTIEFPSCNFAQGTPDFSGADAMIDVTINPNYDTTDDCVVKITRAVT